MVEQQISGRDVTDTPVLQALLKVERHLFVPHDQQADAYGDGPLPIGGGQTISQPYIVAYMTGALKLTRDKNVLEIGTGCGYQTAILAEIARDVYTIERIPRLSEQASALLTSLNYKNIHYHIGNGFNGWPEHAPYDGIVVTCAPQFIPQALTAQLAPGGRMIIPVGTPGYQELLLIRKSDNGKITERALCGVRFVPMVED
ncbi:MAG: protein-L-isoaspartate(D-aspartate) O-methyltransferase [Brevinematales bacterium]|nr:protein-L-isoaspartate(D-aspartate) O-methyltransferase [Brevinematales bacterium]